MPFLLLNQQCQSTEGKIYEICDPLLLAGTAKQQPVGIVFTQ